MSSSGWTLADAPSQRGRVAVVTGANSGIGFETARALARLQAQVVLACRNPDAAQAARDAIVAEIPDARVETVTLDLGDLSSVRAAADELVTRFSVIDLLINNAGVMRQRREFTPDGFEMDFGTNFLGHVALTGLLLGPLLTADAARVVTVGSKVYRAGVVDLDDLTMARGFSPARAYSRAKLAQLMFAVELQRRLDASGRPAMSVAAHPGATQSGVMRDQASWLRWLFTTPSLRWIRRTFIMETEGGALISIRAATDPGVEGGQYFGPGGRLGFSGSPVVESLAAKATDPRACAALFDTAEKLTGVRFDL